MHNEVRSNHANTNYEITCTYLWVAPFAWNLLFGFKDACNTINLLQRHWGSCFCCSENLGLSVCPGVVMYDIPLPWRHNGRHDVSNHMYSTVCSTVCASHHQRKYRSPCYWLFLRGIHRWPVVSPHKGPTTREMFPFDDVIMHPCNIPDSNPTKSHNIYVAVTQSLGNFSLRREMDFRGYHFATATGLVHVALDVWQRWVLMAAVIVDSAVSLMTMCLCQLGTDSVLDKMYVIIPQRASSLVAGEFVFIVVPSLWNFTGLSTSMIFDEIYIHCQTRGRVIFSALDIHYFYILIVYHMYCGMSSAFVWRHVINFCVELKLAEFHVDINSCNADTRYWQKYVKPILATDTSLHVYEKPSAPTTITEVKFSISPLNSSTFVLITVSWFCWRHFERCKIHDRSIYAYNMLTRLLLYIYFTYMCALHNW